MHDNHRFGQKQGVLAAETLDEGAEAPFVAGKMARKSRKLGISTFELFADFEEWSTI